MNIVIVEDEWEACEHLSSLLNEIDPSIKIIKKIDTVNQAISYFKQNKDFDLIFMDIHLADGISFDIFKEVELNSPVVFTTAYDQYAIKAFKVNSIDYILKPLIKEEIEQAIVKFRSQKEQTNNQDLFHNLYKEFTQSSKTYKATFLVQYKEALYPIATSELAGFFIDNGIIKGLTFENKAYVITHTMEQLEEDLNPHDFYRINRQFILQHNSIKRIDYYFNGKLKIKTEPQFKGELIVSKAKASDFKKWLNL